MKVDHRQQLKFASLQGSTAKNLLSDSSTVSAPDPTTIIYLRDGIQLKKSTAILNILTDLGGIFRVFKLLFIIPEFIRDYIYLFIAKNRYRFFGKQETCRMPTSEEQARLLP